MNRILLLVVLVLLAISSLATAEEGRGLKWTALGGGTLIQERAIPGVIFEGVKIYDSGFGWGGMVIYTLGPVYEDEYGTCGFQTVNYLSRGGHFHGALLLGFGGRKGDPKVSTVFTTGARLGCSLPIAGKIWFDASVFPLWSPFESDGRDGYRTALMGALQYRR